jgi:hypothetical protein
MIRIIACHFAISSVCCLLSGHAGLLKCPEPQSSTHNQHSTASQLSRMTRRLAVVTGCSGKDRVTWDERSSAVGAAALAAGKTPHLELPEGKARCPTRKSTGVNQLPRAALHSLAPLALRAAWLRGELGNELPVADGWCTNRTVMCLVSACSMMNVTRGPNRSQSVDHVTLVDEDTPQHIIDMLTRLGVRVIDMSAVRFPAYFNNVTDSAAAASTPALLAGTTVGQAVALGRGFFSSLPNSWYKLWAFNLTEYDKILWHDADTLAIGDVVEHVLEKTPAFAARMHAKSRYLNSGVMVLKPDANVFQQLWRIWQEGDFPYTADRSYGVDDQIFLQHIFYAHRLTGPGTALHALHPCHNDKQSRCSDPDRRVVIYHKTPLWEAGRELALYQAAVAGNCANNAALQRWRYASHPELVAW